MRRLIAILWKNYLLKKAHISGFLAEILLPVAFMGLLIIIKSITDKYDSPNVAYYCGNAFPWFYSNFPQLTLESFVRQIPYVCTQKPSQCQEDHYYEEGISYPVPKLGTSFQGYGQNGYIQSAAANIGLKFPFYTYTIGDTTSVYRVLDIANPSLPFCVILERLQSNKVILAVAPKSSSDSNSVNEAKSLRNYFIQQCNITVSRSNVTLQYDFSSSIVYFNSQDDLNNYLTDRDYDNVGYGSGKVAFAVVIYAADLSTYTWDYAIRANYTSTFDEGDPTVACLYSSPDPCAFTFTIPSTRYFTRNLAKPQTARYLYGYTYSGFATIQQKVDQFIFAKTLSSLGSTQDGVDIMASVSLMPTAAFKSDNFQGIISSTLGIFYMLSFLYPVSRLIRSLVLEKETRIREGMKMMGMTDADYILSWLITTVMQMTLVSVLITLVTSSTIFEYSNKFFVFVYFEAFSLAVISMCFLLSSLFSKSKTASLLGPMMFFVSFFPYYAINDPDFSTTTKTATCILAPACFALGANVFADYEGGLVGIQADNYTEASFNFSYPLCIGMLLFDTVLYGIMAWYLDKVVPSEFGLQLPFYFPFLPSYWLGDDKPKKDANIRYFCKNLYLYLYRAVLFPCRSYRSAEQSDVDVVDIMENPLHEREYITVTHLEENLVPNSSHSEDQLDLQYMLDNPYLEPLPAELRQQLADDSNMRCISIRNLRKEFDSIASSSSSEKRVAVANLNMDLFQGQVTVLLGHNGAGKSTTIGMLVGLVPPTSGTAIMPGGYNINRHMQAIRGNLGVCPQHDILFPELTALQHLQIYAVLKGVSSSQVQAASERMIDEVGLKEKANSKTCTLSGGQKRKLSLGIALIGDSGIVVLDEPTSGMDPYSRRMTWNIIQRNKKGRVILLTTHFMDEADLLGDRIAIMSNGKLQCMGSSLFLKNKFGVGYTLTVVKLSQSKQQVEELARISQEIENVILKYVPNAEPLSNVGAEQSYRLPFAASETFEYMFRDLDIQKTSLGIAEYGVSVTTLEEVFLRVDRHDFSSDNDSGVINDYSSGRQEWDSEQGTQPSVLRERSRELFIDSKGAIPVTPRGADVQIEPTPPLLAPGKGPQGEVEEVELMKTFVYHFSALLQKRFIYGKRDKRMILCQIILPFIVVVLGLSLLLLRPDLYQQDYILSPLQYNHQMDESLRNFVPFFAENDVLIGVQMQSRFSGLQDVGVDGMAVPIDNSWTKSGDAFAGCSEGANVLYNMSQFLLQKQPDSEMGSSRYGAITIASNSNLSNLNYNVMVNGSADHGVGIYVNQVHQAFLQVLTNTNTAKITTRNYPLPPTFEQQKKTAAISAFIVALFCMIACCLIPASLVVFIVKEREVKAKHQQIISGVSIYAYWCSSYVWDIVSYVPTAFLIYMAMLAFQVKAYTEGSAVSAIVALFLMFGPSSVAMTYLLSFLFSSHSTAQVAVMFFNFTTGLCLMAVSFVMTFIPQTMEVNLTLRYVYRLFPSFCLGDGLIQLAFCDGEFCPVIDKNGYSYFATESPLSWDTTGADITFMAIESVVYFFAVLLIEYCSAFPSFLSFLHYEKGPPYEFVADNEDDDVVTERGRVLSGNAVNDVVRIQELRKVYPVNSHTEFISLSSLSQVAYDAFQYCANRTMYAQLPDASTHTTNNEAVNGFKVAVQSLCFGVPRGECFGFLGINGAGKTTTLSILSGEFPPTSGEAYIDGVSIHGNQSNIRKRIGYCPQFESLLELLTVREHLELYGKIKGLRAERLKNAVQNKIDQLDLQDFENKVAGSLSGGNKRKLTFAVATIGDPSIVFLDEPSTGMDPVSRRFMWKVIAKMSTQDASCSVILTTHSMEEAEALCTRIGVMVNGRLCCIGSGQHLKHRFGNGYEINIKTTPVNMLRSKPVLFALRQSLSDNYPGVEDSKVILRQSNLLMSFLTDFSNEWGDDQMLEAEWERLGAIFISRKEVKAICKVLAGDKDRFSLITAGQSGDSVDSILTIDRRVSMRGFLEWFLAEDVSDVIERYMEEAFPNRYKFLERTSLLNFRYRVFQYEVSHDGVLLTSALADIFSKFERNKAYLTIQEYSIGQTTLEQIFNQFASGQDNPEIT